MPRISKIGHENAEKIKLLYANGNSVSKIAKIYKVTYAPMLRYMIKHQITRRTLKESNKGEFLKQWRANHDPWNKGLTIDDPRVKLNIEKNKIAQIKNGKNKGKNNPMWGKTVQIKNNFKSGFREDLGHYVRSSWEANFARVLKFLKINYEYEKQTFLLKDGTTYTPDFYIPNKKTFYEIKGWVKNLKHEMFQKEYPELSLKIFYEKQYKRIIKMFRKKIDFKSFL